MNILFAILAATLFEVAPTNATVSFSVMKWGVVREEGNFRDFHATIEHDERDICRSSVSFAVKAASVDTKNGRRDETLRSDDFLHAQKYPTLTFRSTRVVPRGRNVADVTGDLTVRGVTKRITIPVRLVGMGRDHEGRKVAGFETAFTIDRRQFGVNGSRWSGGVPGILGHEVAIRIVAGGVSR